jgi:hypothetical protein
MAISRAAVRDLLLPGLFLVEGRYPQIERQWPQLFWRSNSKMALERAAEMRYAGLAQIKAEGGATVFDNAPGERFIYNIEHVALGLGIAMTREALDDNLYKDQFGPMSMGLAESFHQTEEILHANVLNSGTVYQSTIVGDGQPLFSTAHPIDNGTYANRPSPDLGLNEASLEYATQQIRVFPDQAGLRMQARAQRMVVPIALQYTSFRLTRADLRPGTANNDITAYIAAGALKENNQVMDYLSSPTAWFVTSSIKGLVSFNRIPFELDMQIDPVTGNLMIIAYQRYGVGYVNPRSCWGSFPSA